MSWVKVFPGVYEGIPDQLDGQIGIRDWDSPCSEFNSSPRQLGDFTECEGDGHYLCRKCKWLDDIGA